MIKKGIGLIPALGLSVCLLAGLAQGVPEAKPAVAKPHHKPEFLYVAVVTQTDFKQLSGGDYQLTVSRPYLKTLLTFSDKPARIAYPINPDQFFQVAALAKGNFIGAMPNLALAFEKGQVATFALKAYHLDTQKVVLTLKQLGKQQVPSSYTGHMAMFVDNGTTPCYSESQVESDVEQLEAAGKEVPAMPQRADYASEESWSVAVQAWANDIMEEDAQLSAETLEELGPEIL